MLNPEEDLDHRVLAVALLGLSADAAAVPTLMLALHELGTRLVGEVFLAHGLAVRAQARIWLVQDDDVERRLSAVLCYVLLEDPAVLPRLVEITSDGERRERAAGCFALARQRLPQALAPLVTVLREDQDSSVRGSAAEALGHLGNNKAAEALDQAMHSDPEPTVRRSAVRGLERLPGEHVDGLLRVAPKLVSCEARAALDWRGRYPDLLGIHPQT
ncbi:MAG: HEAT repeat domain-containing protein [Solirubrobacteraceae bacterium]